MGTSANQVALVTGSSRGLGEVAMAGVAAAIGNAIFHATRRRLRELPIRIVHLFHEAR
jgi:xanthine dehydrogenase YagR molybdenum-binding subunit